MHVDAIIGLGRGYHLVGGDQPGFATAVSEWGDFSDLPIACNYRPPCFGLGLAQADELVLLHLTRFDFEDNLEASVRAYWSRRILGPMAPAKERFARRIAIAEEARERVLRIIAAYDLHAMKPSGRQA